MLASQSRALKTRYESKKTLSEKKIRIGLGPRARQSWPKIARTCSHCDVTQRTQNPSRKKFFFDLKSKTCRIRSVEGLINSLALLVGKL